MNPQRAEAIRRLDSIISGIDSQRFALLRLREFLLGDNTRVPAPYEAEPESPEAIMERYGVVDDDDIGEPPAWFADRLPRLIALPENDQRPAE